MVDQNDTQTPPAATPAPVTATTVTTVVEQTFSSIVKALWDKYGIFFIVVGIGLILLKFSSIAVNILGWASKENIAQAQKTDAQLKSKETVANQQADALVQQAQDLPKTEGQVSDDWYKKGK